MAKDLKVSDRVKIIMFSRQTPIIGTVKFVYEEEHLVKVFADSGVTHDNIPFQWSIKLKPKKKKKSYSLWIKTDGALSSMGYKLEQDVCFSPPVNPTGWIEMVHKKVKK